MPVGPRFEMPDDGVGDALHVARLQQVTMMRIDGLGVQLSGHDALPTGYKIFVWRAFGSLQQQYLAIVFWRNVLKGRRFADLLRGAHFRAFGLVAGSAFEEFFDVFASVRKTDL